MPVQVGCAQCGKKYRIDDKFIGKKIRCKNCQNVMRVEGEAAGAVAAAPRKAAAKASVPVVKKRVSSGSGVQQRSAPQPEALDLPDLSGLDGLDVPSGPTLELDEPEVRAGARASEAGCPSCGAPFPAANRVCMNCGFNRASGQQAKTQVEKSSLSRGPSGLRHDSSGKRLWQPYDNPVLNYLDTAIPKASVILFLGVGLVYIVAFYCRFISTGRTLPPIVMAVAVVVVVISMGLFWTVVLNITMAGVKLAGSIFKFEAPEDGRARLIGMHMIAFLFPVVMVLASVLINPRASFGFIMCLFFFAVATYFLVCFACFKILFHLKWVEAIGSYLIMFAFYVMGTLITIVLDSIVLAAAKGIIIAALRRGG
jgi:hypothetical protein